MPRLIVKTKDSVKEVTILKDSFSIGRLPENDLELADNLSSRRHCEIIKRGTDYLVYDLGSANGTFMNKKKIKSEIIKDGDKIQIGTTVITFKAESSVMAPNLAETSSDVVKSIGELSLDYRLDFKDIIARGESLSSAVKPLGQEKASKRFFILYHLARAITSATSLNEVLDIAMSSVFDVINAERGVIMILDKEAGKLTHRLTKCKSGTKQETPYVSQTITNNVLSNKVAIITSDARHDPRFQAGLSIAQFNIRSALCVPLWEKEDVFGVIYVDNLMKSYAFTNDDLELLSAIANLVAIRIQQDELHNSLKREALVRSNLERYHSPDVVEMIIQQSADKGTELEVKEKEITVLFADIQNFTTLSEKITPRQLAEMLNEFFETTTQIVFEHKGSVNKYIGDALLATFGAPIDLPDHQLQAAWAGLKMVKAIQELHVKAPTEAPKYTVRIGINTGVVVAGNVGAQKRIEYAVLGDTVNIASRLNQYAGADEVAVGENTYQAIKETIQATPLGGVQLKGKTQEVQVYKLVTA